MKKMAAQQTSHYFALNSKQLLRKHRAASPKTFQQSQPERGHSVNAKSASSELRPHQTNRLLLPIKHKLHRKVSLSLKI